MNRPKARITHGKTTMYVKANPFMIPNPDPATHAAAAESAAKAVGDMFRADDAHQALTETLEHLQAAFGSLFTAYDAYPDDLGKHEAYPAAIGTLAQTIKMVQALDVSARSWKGNRA